MIPGIQADGAFGMKFGFQSLDGNGAKYAFGQQYEMKLVIEQSEKSKQEAEKKKVENIKPKKVYAPFVVDKAKVLCSMFGVLEEKTLEYVDSKKYSQTEALIDELLTDEALLKKLSEWEH